jgi:hypothetical protein
MVNPILPNISYQEAEDIYKRLERYNLGRASYKEEGAYIVVLPHEGHPRYTMWVGSPKLERQRFLPIGELSDDIMTSLSMATTWFRYSRLPVILVNYNEKHMRSNGDDLISFGKYRGHYLGEVRRIDPRYLSWIAYQYRPDIPKAKRFQQIARYYDMVNQDLELSRLHNKPRQRSGNFLGNVGEKLSQLTLTVTHVQLEDDPYKSGHYSSGTIFYVTQRLTLTDPDGNLVLASFPSHNPSLVSCQLSAMEHAFKVGDTLHVKTAKVAQNIQGRQSNITRLIYVVLEE